MNIHSLLLLALVGASFCSFAQALETDLSEVDRILAEIETDESSDTDSTTTAESDEFVETTTADDTPEEMGESFFVTTEPRSVPAINLEEAIDVEGLEIQGGEDINRGLITLVYREVKLADMVRIFAQTSGANIIIPEGLDELVSGNLNDVYWREALDVILGDKGYTLVERKSGIFTINSIDDMALEPLTSESIDLQFITAEAALPAIQSMIVTSNAKVIPIPQTNVLIVSETPQRMQEIKRVLQLVDRPRRQVFIEAKFVELNDSAIKDLGINWEVLQNYRIGAAGLVEYSRTTNRLDQDAQGFVTGRVRRSDNLSDPLNTNAEKEERTSSNFQLDGLVQGRNFENFDVEDGSLVPIPRMQEEVIRSAVLSASEFAVTLSALQQLDGVRIVSNPKMLVANGQTATIHVGRNEPNITATYVQTERASGYVYGLDSAKPFIEIGVKLSVTPVISTDRNITIKIVPELSRLLGDKSAGDAGLSYPITSIRKIDTEFAVESGNTVAIGGLTQSEEQESVSKIPLLGDLPIIGKYLFSKTTTKTVQDEVMIFVSVDSVESDGLVDQDRQGIPEHGRLIHTWLDHQRMEKEAREAGVVLE